MTKKALQPVCFCVILAELSINERDWITELILFSGSLQKSFTESCSKGFCKGFSKRLTYNQSLLNNEAQKGGLESEGSPR